MEPERPRLAFVEDASVPRDQIKTIGPTGIGRFNAIVEVIDDSRKLYAQGADASVCYGDALSLITRTSEEHPIADVALHLPDIGGMGFEDVHGVEIGFALILLRQFVEGGNLPPERRSSIASENQNNRSFRPQRRKPDRHLTFEPLDREIGRGIARAECSFARIHPHRLERK